MHAIRGILIIGLFGSAIATCGSAQAQYPVVRTVQPAVVGYSASRRGLFGRRVVVRPVVAPVATYVPVAPVSVARPVVAAPAPVTVRYAPVATPVVRAYYAPAPVVARVRTYRVPVVTYRYGF